MPKSNKQYEFMRAVFPGFVVKSDDKAGRVDAVVSTFGVIDYGEDVVHPGSFKKTLMEHFHKVRVLDHHKTDSILRVIGKPISAREIGRDELPMEILEKYPEATGGLLTTTDYLIHTPEGLGAYQRVAEGLLDFSFGFDILDSDYEIIENEDGTKSRIRNIRSVRLWEWSPVIWGMNPATATVHVKRAEDGRPVAGYDIKAGRQESGEETFCWELSPDACGTVIDDNKEMGNDGPTIRLGDYLQATIHEAFTYYADFLYKNGFLDTEQRILLSAAIGNALSTFKTEVPEDLLLMAIGGGFLWEQLGVPPEYFAQGLMFNADAPEDTKAGRQISEKNAKDLRAAHEKLGSAYDTLANVMQRAGLTEESSDEKSETGPVEEPPIDDKSSKTEMLPRESVLQSIDLLAAQIDQARGNSNE